MAIVIWIYIECGTFQSDPQNMAIVCWIYKRIWPLSIRSTKCGYCQLDQRKIPYKIEALSARSIKHGFYLSGPLNVAIVNWIYINCDFCPSVPQYVTLLSRIYKKVVIVIQIHKMWLINVNWVYAKCGHC